MGFKEVATLTFTYIIASICTLYFQDLHLERVGIVELGQTYSEWVSIDLLFGIRLFCTLIIWGTVVIVVADPKGLSIVSDVNGVRSVFSIKHFERLTMFTMWAWLLQGFYFILATYGTYIARNINEYGSEAVPSWVPSLAWILFEVSLPVSFLVSLVVTYVLIPGMKKSKLSTDLFFTANGLILHNCNVLFMAIEFMANGLPINFWHFGFIFLLVGAYCVFSWIWHKIKGLHYYFFTDYNRSDALAWQVGLLAIFYCLYMVCCGCSYVRMHYNGYIPSLVVFTISFMAMKLRDT